MSDNTTTTTTTINTTNTANTANTATATNKDLTSSVIRAKMSDTSKPRSPLKSLKTNGLESIHHSSLNERLNLNNLRPNEKIIVATITKRDSTGLGFLIRQRNEMPFFSIWEIIKDGAAEKCGKIKKSDIILKVNDEDLTNKSYEKGLEILKSVRPGTTITLTLLSGFADDTFDNENASGSKYSTHASNHMSSSNRNGSIMSPLQKLKKKLINCASSNSPALIAKEMNITTQHPMIAPSQQSPILSSMPTAPIYSSSSAAAATAAAAAASTSNDSTIKEHFSVLAKTTTTTVHSPSKAITATATAAVAASSTTKLLNNNEISPSTSTLPASKKNSIASLDEENTNKISIQQQVTTTTSTTHSLMTTTESSQQQNDCNKPKPDLQKQNLLNLKNKVANHDTSFNNNTNAIRKRIIPVNVHYNEFCVKRENANETSSSNRLETSIPLVDSEDCSTACQNSYSNMVNCDDVNDENETKTDCNKYTQQNDPTASFMNNNDKLSINTIEYMENEFYNNNRADLDGQPMLKLKNDLSKFNSLKLSPKHDLKESNKNRSNTERITTTKSSTYSTKYHIDDTVGSNNLDSEISEQDDSFISDSFASYQDSDCLNGSIVVYNNQQHRDAKCPMTNLVVSSNSCQSKYSPSRHHHHHNHHHQHSHRSTTQQKSNQSAGNTIKIISDGENIRINIDGGIEIRTNRSSNRKFISVSPHSNRKALNANQIKQQQQKQQKCEIKSELSPNSNSKMKYICSSSSNDEKKQNELNNSSDDLEAFVTSNKSDNDNDNDNEDYNNNEPLLKTNRLVNKPDQEHLNSLDSKFINKLITTTTTKTEIQKPTVIETNNSSSSISNCNDMNNNINNKSKRSVQIANETKLIEEIEICKFEIEKKIETKILTNEQASGLDDEIMNINRVNDASKTNDSTTVQQNIQLEEDEVKQQQTNQLLVIKNEDYLNQSNNFNSDDFDGNLMMKCLEKKRPTISIENIDNDNYLDSKKIQQFNISFDSTINNRLNTAPSRKNSNAINSRSQSPSFDQKNMNNAGSSNVSATVTPSPTLNNLSSSTSMLSFKNRKKGTKLRFLLDESTTVDMLHHKAIGKTGCTPERCVGSLLQSAKIAGKQARTKEEIIEHAVDFINQFYASVKREGSKTHKERLEEVINSINQTNSYELKETELCFGARTAWRNAPRCIGRISWSKLQVFDARYVTTARGMFEAICNHLKYVTNKGNIRSAITIFKQRTEPGHDFRVWNSQFITYAGFKMPDNTLLGDKAQIEFTEICMKMGWKPKMVEFEVLPLVLQANGQDPEWFEISPDLIMDVKLIHPKFEWFVDLNMKWYCVPAVTSMMLDIGGLEFTACPFNGWYMGTEIGRDLADINRFDKLPLIAEKMGLDTRTNASLWKDKALVELNHAILYSFQKAAATIMDHHSAAESFMKHYENENQLRGGCPADWVWVVPPLSSHLTPVFHLEMVNYVLKPSYEYQEAPWKTHIWKQQKQQSEDKTKRTRKRVYFSDIARAVKFSAKLMGKALARRVKCTILYATETGKSERFAKLLAEIFKHAFDAKTLSMKDYDVVDLEHETLLIMVTSTFGNGDPPENGEEFKKFLMQMRKDQTLLNKNHNDQPSDISLYEYSGALTNVRFAVFALGNSSYPKYCSYGRYLDESFEKLGAERIYQLGLGDELCGQEESFRNWSATVFKNAVETFCIDTDTSFVDSLSNDELGWSPHTIRLTLVENKEVSNICESLSKLHNKKILPCKLVNRRNLQCEISGRKTNLIELNTQGHSGELQYKPGDHIGIFAENRKELVDAILAKVANSPPSDQLVKIELLKEKPSVFGVSKQWIVDDRYPSCTLRSALTNFLDITSTISQNMLMYLSTQASNENDRQQLEKLSKDHIAYEEWRLNGFPNLVEVLHEFPSLRPHASLLMTQLPKLQPRFYSISSSPKITDDIHITIGVVQYKLSGKSIRYGVCSKWLDELQIGKIVPSFVRTAPSFRLPEDKTLPIVLVGAGTGIAPFRSFWQERKVDKEIFNENVTGFNGKGWSETSLYFGCRRPDHDELYRGEIDQLISEKVINKYYPAYSREPNKEKTYVQHILSKNTKYIFDAIYKRKGHFYICGDVRMAAEVTNTLEDALHIEGKMSIEDAKKYVNEMKENQRFHEDIFGINVTLQTNK